MLYTLFITPLITQLKQLIYKQAPELLGKGQGGWVSTPQQSSARSPQPRVSPRAPEPLTQPLSPSSVGEELRHSPQLALLAAATREQVAVHRQHHQVVVSCGETREVSEQQPLSRSPGTPARPRGHSKTPAVQTS